MSVLVDTSVWVDHFRHGNHLLVRLLESDQVLTHPLVMAEIACGTPPEPRAHTLANLQRLHVSRQATRRREGGSAMAQCLEAMGNLRFPLDCTCHGCPRDSAPRSEVIGLDRIAHGMSLARGKGQQTAGTVGLCPPYRDPKAVSTWLLVIAIRTLPCRLALTCILRRAQSHRAHQVIEPYR